MPVLEKGKRVLGEEHSGTLLMMWNLALIYYKQERWKEAKELLVSVLERRTRVLGNEHLDTLEVIEHLAWIHEEMSHEEDAIQDDEGCYDYSSEEESSLSIPSLLHPEDNTPI